MSAIGPGDLVQIVRPGQCSYGFLHHSHAEHAGMTARALSHPYTDPFWPDRKVVDLSYGPAGCCLGCLRKLNDGDDNAELIARIKGKRTVKQGEMA